MKLILPWIVALAALAGACWFYSSAKTRQTELAALRPQLDELPTLRTENAELKRTEGQSEELIRLRKDNEDLLRLRNEIRQLRDEKQQLAKQAQTAQAQVQVAQSQMQALQTTAAQAQQNAQAILQQQQLAEQQRQSNASAQQAANVCINNLRQIDGAVQQWALENKKTAASGPSASDLAPYLPNNTFPKCPAGGVYSIYSVGTRPTCNIPGHALPRQ